LSPHTVATSAACPPANGTIWIGPCGKAPHCESAPASEAVFDLVQELKARGMADFEAFEKAQSLFFSSRPGAGSMFTCQAGSNGGSNGGSLYQTLRAADDCDGNLANGTPNAAAIYAALASHGIAVGAASDAANQNDPTVPVASFVYSCNSSGTCTFDAGAAVPANGITKYSWTFGDSTIGSGKVVSHTFLASGTYTVQLTITDACSRTATTSRAVPVTTPAVTMGETGLVTIARNPVTVTLRRTYTNPVVFAQPLSYGAWTPPAVPRVYNVTPTSFALRIDSEYLPPNAQYQWETVSFIVLEAGLWKVQGSNARLEVGKISTAATVGLRFPNQWAHVNFTPGFLQTPVILSQVQTSNNYRWVSNRQRLASTSGFDLAMEPLEVETTPHTIETLGWLAIQPGTGQWTGFNYTADRSQQVNDDWYWLTFASPCTSGWWHPFFMASIGTYNERHGHLRWRPLNYSYCAREVRVEEDTSYDAETDHVNEELDYLNVEGDRLLKAEPLQP